MMIKLVSCVQENINIVGSDNFESIENGRITDIVEYWENENTILATAKVSPGYYYLGVAAKTNNTLYYISPLYSSSL